MTDAVTTAATNAAASADVLTFTLIAPERVLAKLSARSVTMPASEGELGVLPQHAPLITALKAGVVTVATTDGNSERLFVAGGFAEIAPDSVTLLADEASAVAELDIVGLRADRERLHGELREAADDADCALLQAQLDVIEAKLQAAA